MSTLLSFFARNVVAGGLLIILGSAGVLAAAAGFILRRQSTWTAVIALAFASICIGAAWVQRVALLNAAAAAGSMAGLATSDRARIVAADLADARYATVLGVAIGGFALLVAACSVLLAPTRRAE